MNRQIVRRTSSFISMLLKRMKDHDVSGMAAQLAFFFLLSLFPLLLFLATLLPYLPISEQDIVTFLAAFVPEESMLLIESQIQNIMRGSGKLLSFGIIATLWSASNGMNGIFKAFNRAYEIEGQRTYFINRVISMILTIAMLFVFIFVLALPVFGKQLGILLFSQFGYNEEFLHMWNTIRWFITSLLLFCVFTVLYWIFPNIRLKLSSVMRGAIFATVGWIVVSLGFSFYVNNFASYTSTYGSIGGIIVLMLWFYLSAHIIILGGELNAMTRRTVNK